MPDSQGNAIKQDDQPIAGVAAPTEGGAAATGVVRNRQVEVVMTAPEQAIAQPDGTVFTKYDSQGRPIAGFGPGPIGGPVRPFTVTYLEDGCKEVSYVDLTKVYVNALGDVVKQVMAHNRIPLIRPARSGHAIRPTAGRSHTRVTAWRPLAGRHNGHRREPA